MAVARSDMMEASATTSVAVAASGVPSVAAANAVALAVAGQAVAISPAAAVVVGASARAVAPVVGVVADRAVVVVVVVRVATTRLHVYDQPGESRAVRCCDDESQLEAALPVQRAARSTISRLIFGDVARPAFRCVERDHTDGLLIPAVDDVADDRRAVHFVFVGLPIDTESAEVMEDDARFKIECGK
jgi:hypothetical protein